MKKQLLSCCLAALGLTTAIQAQNFNEWKDPEVNSVNRSAMHTNYFAYASADEAKAGSKEDSQNFMTLNGLWKFNWVRTRRLGIEWLWRSDLRKCRLCLEKPISEQSSPCPHRKQSRRLLPKRNRSSCRLERKRHLCPLRLGNFQYVSLGKRPLRRL